MARQVAHTPTDFFAPPPPMSIEEDWLRQRQKYKDTKKKTQGGIG